MDPTKLRRTDWKPFWGDSSPFDLGLQDEVAPKVQIVTAPIKAGTTGQFTLGKRMIDAMGQVTCQVRETTLNAFQKLTPWWSSGSIPIAPATPNIDFYQYAQLLKLHPADLILATVTEDLNFPKAVPMHAMNLTRNGNNDDVFLVTFDLYVDRAKLAADPPTIVIGYVGNVPP
jgi:hypothetical protein